MEPLSSYWNRTKRGAAAAATRARRNRVRRTLLNMRNNGPMGYNNLANNMTRRRNNNKRGNRSKRLFSVLNNANMGAYNLNRP